MSWRREDDGSFVSREACHLTTDDEGHFKAIPFPEFTVNDFFMERGGGDEFPGITLKSPNDKFEPLSLETFAPIGKTVAFGERNQYGYPTLTFVKDYTWQTPLKEVFKPECVVTNTVLLPVGLTEAIKKHWENIEEEYALSLDAVAVMVLDLNGEREEVFLVDRVRPKFDSGDTDYVIFGKTGETYSEMGTVRKGFAEYAVHEKTNGQHSVEFCYSMPTGYEYYDARSSSYVRDLYVFDGKRYNIAVRSWCKSDEPVKVEAFYPKGFTKEK